MCPPLVYFPIMHQFGLSGLVIYLSEMQGRGLMKIYIERYFITRLGEGVLGN